MKSTPNLFRTSRFSLASSVAVLCLGGSSLGLHAAVWDGSDSTDWNNGANWDTNAVPTGQSAIIRTNTGNIATISANPSVNPNDVIVGDAAGQDARLDHTAGTLTTGSWVKIGHNSGNGIYNLADTAGSGGTLTGFGQGSGSLNMTGGQLRLGGDNGTNTSGNATFNMHTSGTVTVNNGAVAIGQNGNGTLNIDSGTFNKTGSGNFVVGGTSGRTGTLNMSGGTINNSGEFQVSNSGSTGVVTMTGGTINTGSWVGIGHGGGGTGTLNMNGGTFNKTGSGSAFIVGDGSNGTLNQTAGLIDTQGEFWIGNGGGSTATNYNMSGGTLNTTSWFVVGRDGGTATITMTGGTVNNTGTGSDLVVGGDSAGSNGTIAISGGLMNITGRNTDIGKVSGTGALTISGTGEFRTGNLNVGSGGSASGTVNLNGGTLKISALNGGAGSATVHFNGTQIQAQGNSSDFIQGLDTADIQTGGAKIDTQAFTISASQAFTGSGGLTKSGSGTLVLTGNSTFSGATLVSAGTLLVNGSIGSSATTVSSGATVGGNGTLGAVSVNSGAFIAAGNSIGTLNAASADIDGTMLVEYDGSDSGTIDLLTVTGVLDISNATVDFSQLGASADDGAYVFASYGSLIGSFSNVFNLPSGGYYIDYAFNNGISSNNIALVIPEPGAALIGSLGALVLLGRRRR